jgi:hypothetical protein
MGTCSFDAFGEWSSNKSLTFRTYGLWWRQLTIVLYTHSYSGWDCGSSQIPEIREVIVLEVQGLQC